MKHWLINFLISIWLAYPALALAGASSSPDADSFSHEIRPLLDEYCAKCHGPAKSKGGVNLSSFTNTISFFHDVPLWEKVAEKVRSHDMPPEGKPQPADAQRAALLAWVEKALKDLNEGRLAADPGRVLIHRLSRTEYNCTIRDLFGVDSKPADKFPSDGGGGGGFDNNADTLFIPPILMERYLAAAADVLDQAPRERIFFAQKGLLTSERSAARKIIEEFARRGFRRPVEVGEAERLLGLFDHARQKGQEFEPAVKTALTAILVSPNFLYRVERDIATPQPYRITDFELASRLSYFLWSSMPDEELFKLAVRNRLHDPEVLTRQVQRMIHDPKSKAFSDNFAGQWLRVRELRTAAQPDTGKFPAYTPALQEAMYGEVIEFFASLINEDQSLLKLLDADYTFVNADLAQLYGIKGIQGPALQRVSLSDHNRGGILGMAAVLTLTSYPLRTSPVLRGKWVLEQILGTPPPPPPPLVESLPKNDKVVDGLTLRQRLEKHREKPECASCHQRMDPLGFGLENFDAIGQWRTNIAGQPVDSSGVLPGGEKFQGPVELRKVLLNRREDFVRNLTEKMLAYSLGRGLDYYDTPTVRKISKTLAEHDYRSSVLITEIVKSYPFQFRRNEPIPPTMP
ncbi:MAG: Protein of unknown function (DUF1587)/Protein of unknown function (DUF1592)/Protein of unknown [Pedosphaera sp.]|nr:Protein of unknown function (DUF1587)/Protein of unknown function (DUF1592)/Protein of unknown [Pedosphaera sp.]